MIYSPGPALCGHVHATPFLLQPQQPNSGLIQSVSMLPHSTLIVLYLCVRKISNCLVSSAAVQGQRVSLSAESQIFITLKALLQSHLLFVCCSIVRFQTVGEENRDYCAKMKLFQWLNFINIVFKMSFTKAFKMFLSNQLFKQAQDARYQMRRASRSSKN